MLSARRAGCGAALWLGLASCVLCRAWTAPSASRKYRPPARSPAPEPRPCCIEVPPWPVPSPRCLRPGFGCVSPLSRTCSHCSRQTPRPALLGAGGPRVVTLEMFLESCAWSWRWVGSCLVRGMRVDDGFSGVVHPLRSVSLCVCVDEVHGILLRWVSGWKVTTMAEISFLFLFMAST